MDLQYLRPARGFYLKELEKFLSESGLDFDPGCTFTVNALEDDEIIATGSLEKNVLKCIAVSEKHQGEGLSATIITALRSQAFDNGEEHLFLFTKPKNIEMFGGLGFYPVAKTQDALLMESVRGGCDSFVAALPKKKAQLVRWSSTATPLLWDTAILSSRHLRLWIGCISLCSVRTRASSPPT